MPRRFKNIFAHGEADSGLRLVAHQRQVAIEQIVRLLAFALVDEIDHAHQHLGIGIARHGAIGAALHLEGQEHAAVAAENRHAAHLARIARAAQSRDLVETGPVLVLEHDAGGALLDDPHDHFRCHDHVGGERVILDHPRHIRADGLDGIGVVGDDLVVGLEGRRRRDHHACCTRIHDLGGQARHGGKACGRNADDDGNAPRHRGDDLTGEGQSLIGGQLGRLAHDAENRQASGAGLEIGLDHTVRGSRIDPPVALEGRGADDVDAGGRTREQGFLLDKAGQERSGPLHTPAFSPVHYPAGAYPV